MAYPGGKYTRNLYDSVGRMTKVGAGSDGSVDPTEYFYHGTTGLMTKVRYTSGANTYDAVYAYNTANQLTKLTDWIDGTNGLQYAYDPAGRLTKLTDYDASHLDYTYDASGNVVTMSTYHGSVFTYTYTDTNQLSTITSPGSKTWTYTYDATGQPNIVSIPNGMTTNYAYDARNRVTQIEHKDGATVDDGFAYALDPQGDITRTTHQDNAYWSYLYDGRHRLTKAERYDASSTLLKRWTYTYSAGDNMTTKQVYTPPSTTDTYVYAYTTVNELTKQTLASTDTTFAYDAWGRQTSKAQGGYSATYYYNYGDKLTKVASSFPGEGTVTYKVGADGKRRERNDGTATAFNWDAGWNVIEEENSGGTLINTYCGDLADISGSNPATGSYRYYSKDNIGSTRRLRNTGKTSLGKYEYDPYGAAYFESGDTITHRYGGLDYDPVSRLSFAPYRYYVPELGLWMERDPRGVIDGPNIYSYVKRNPTALVDPLGEQMETVYFNKSVYTHGCQGIMCNESVFYDDESAPVSGYSSFWGSYYQWMKTDDVVTVFNDERFDNCMEAEFGRNYKESFVERGVLYGLAFGVSIRFREEKSFLVAALDYLLWKRKKTAVEYDCVNKALVSGHVYTFRWTSPPVHQSKKRKKDD